MDRSAKAAAADAEAAEAAKEAAIEEQAREEDAVAGASSVDRTRFVFLAFRSIPFFARPARVWRVTIQSDRDIRPRCEENIWIRHGDMLC